MQFTFLFVFNIFYIIKVPLKSLPFQVSLCSLVLESSTGNKAVSVHLIDASHKLLHHYKLTDLPHMLQRKMFQSIQSLPLTAE